MYTSHPFHGISMLTIIFKELTHATEDFLMGVAIDPICINVWRLETLTNLMQFKWGSRVNRHFLF